MPRSRKKTLVEIAFTLLVSVGLLFFAHNNSRRSSSTMTSLPDTQDWDLAHAGPTKPFPLTPAVLNSTALAPKPSGDLMLNFTNKAGSPQRNAYEYRIHRIKPGEMIDLDGNRIRLESLCVQTIPTSNSKPVEQWYAPDLTPIAQQQHRRLITPNNIDNYMPWIRFQFSREKLNSDAELKVVQFDMFDVRTHERIWHASAHSGPAQLDSAWAEAMLMLYHNTPVEVMIEFATGPVATYRFPAKPGEGFTTGTVAVKLIGVFADRSGGVSYENSIINIIRTGTLHVGEQELIFFGWPDINVMDLECFGVDANGKSLGAGQQSILQDKFLMNQTFPKGLGKIESIMLRRHRNRHRVFFELPRVPGLPAENTNIQDLLDVRIPHVVFRDANELETFVQRVLQVHGISSTGHKSPSSRRTFPSYPMEFKDATVRDILANVANGGSVSLDSRTRTLVIAYPEPLSARISRLWHSIFKKNFFVRFTPVSCISWTCTYVEREKLMRTKSRRCIIVEIVLILILISVLIGWAFLHTR